MAMGRIASMGLLLAAAALLGGCAAPVKLVPEGYSGPTATLSDSIYQESGSKGRVFAAVEVDAQAIPSALDATRRASAGRGFSLVMAGDGRAVIARPMRVKLVASHITAAPIHEFALRASGEFHSVEGTVDWTPQAGKSYVVRGSLQPTGSSVWIEENATKLKVTDVVVGK
jgi:hypothetical protein